MKKKIGKITQRNVEANKKLKQIYLEKGITKCELKFEGCMYNWGLGFAHKEKRWKYIKTPEKLSDFNETILACTMCHNRIENDKKLTNDVFAKLLSNNT